MSIFDTLPEHKKRAVITAGYTCFGKNGYKKTSVADIAAQAGVSKASIFQYFGTKRQLYSYLFSHACGEITRETPVSHADFFECIQNGTQAKLRAMERFPGMNDFLSSLVTESDRSIIETLRRETEALVSEWTGALYSKVDWSRLRPEHTREQLRSMARWIVDGYINDWVYKKDAQTMNIELAGYLSILRAAFYKEEWINEHD